MKTKKIFAANWKLHKTPLDSKKFIEDFLAQVDSHFFDSREIFIFPQNYSVGLALQTAKGSAIQVGPQNIHTKNSGAYTGENSAELARQMNAQVVLLGHSERRQYFHENSTDLKEKVKICQSLQMTPVYCIGETLQQREQGQTSQICKEQLETVLIDINKNSRVVIAYEPVWAIGTGQVATVEQVREVHELIFILMNQLGFTDFQILYGGSVKPENSNELIQIPHVDGFLIGGASLEVSSFLKICKS